MASVSHALAAAYGLRLSDEGLTLLSSQLEHVDADSIFQLAIDVRVQCNSVQFEYVLDLVD
jgi:hypothetical protein